MRKSLCPYCDRRAVFPHSTLHNDINVAEDKVQRQEVDHHVRYHDQTDVYSRQLLLVDACGDGVMWRRCRHAVSGHGAAATYQRKKYKHAINF